jgi:hypothetical protein
MLNFNSSQFGIVILAGLLLSLPSSAIWLLSGWVKTNNLAVGIVSMLVNISAWCFLVSRLNIEQEGDLASAEEPKGYELLLCISSWFPCIYAVKFVIPVAALFFLLAVLSPRSETRRLAGIMFFIAGSFAAIVFPF